MALLHNGLRIVIRANNRATHQLGNVRPISTGERPWQTAVAGACFAFILFVVVFVWVIVEGGTVPQ